MAAAEAVRLTLRLLTASRALEREIDALMRAEFGASIARFDFLAALERRGPRTLGEISRGLLVSNGNVTQLAGRLERDGLIQSQPDRSDRRVRRVRLTARGESVFRQMAKAHAACVDRLLAGLTREDRTALMRLLDAAKTSMRRAEGGAAR